jgi:hypothetical protein
MFFSGVLRVLRKERRRGGRVEEEENEIAGDCSLMIVIVITSRVLIMGLCEVEIIQGISIIEKQSVRIRAKRAKRVDTHNESDRTCGPHGSWSRESKFCN